MNSWNLQYDDYNHDKGELHSRLINREGNVVYIDARIIRTALSRLNSISSGSRSDTQFELSCAQDRYVIQYTLVQEFSTNDIYQSYSKSFLKHIKFIKRE